MDPNQEPQNTPKPEQPEQPTTAPAPSFTPPTNEPGNVTSSTTKAQALDTAPQAEPAETSEQPTATPDFVSNNNTAPVVSDANSQSAPVSTDAPEAAPAASNPAAAVASQGEDPGKVLGIVSIVLDCVGLSLVGMVLGFLSRKKSKEAGHPTTLGTVGMVLGIVFTVLAIPFWLMFILAASNGMQDTTLEGSSTPSSSTTTQF